MKKNFIDENSFLFKFLISVKGFFLSLFMYILRIFPIKNNRIIIMSYYGKGYGDNGKYIANKLSEKQKYEIYWGLNNTNDKLPSNIKVVKYKSLKYYYILTTSKIWFNNCRFPFWIKKRKKQVYFQLWHGNIALKKIEFDVPEKLGYRYIKSAIKDNKNIDYMISNGKFCTDILYRGAFKYQKEILEYGTPRNDILVNNNKCNEKVYDSFNITNKNKILLYAPTFRKNYRGQYNIDFEKLIENLNKLSNHEFEWKVLLRLHPNVSEKANEYNIKYNNNILDACFYDDMQELISTSDFVITDYSSVMFDAMIANKPVVLYANDIKEYNDERGTYFSFEELPFEKVENNQELLELIKKVSFDKMKEKYENFNKKIGLIESGDSCDKICKLVEKITYGDVNDKNNK